MSNVPGVIPSAAAGVPLIPTKRTRLEYSTVAKTAIKDSVKPNKLQSLELNGKNMELISKENKDRFTESNSVKQRDEINLELSDQPIYANSSCPSTLNFKKEWDKSDENYTENNVSVAVIGMDLSMN
ncbi:hypothetical protein BB561_005975 [Smittium simulii]|uniref:Uncharacterized protein n=1 Tax=Smittium simulii TaxID=133385 RepID=A0A2T9Y792_9FUNG|nr:hypothetical protein BB561_005975 [Smittium simulii]